jgi:citrate lyase alpha subunit
MGEKIAGKAKKAETEDKIVARVIYRDGKELDVIRQIKS